MASNPTATEPDILITTFQSFFEGWLIRQQAFLDQLLSISSENSTAKDEEYKHLIDQIFSHYNQYYQEKAKVASDNVYLLFSPPWLSSTERTLLWIAGFKPSLLFRLMNGSVHDLSAEQARRVEQVKAETRREEKELMETMARLQESVAAPPLVDVVRHVGRLINGDQASRLDSPMVELKLAMLMVLASADALRGVTARKVTEILSPAQTVKFLAAAAQFQLQIRRWGLHRDCQREMRGICMN